MQRAALGVGAIMLVQLRSAAINNHGKLLGLSSI
jgi:hypothetical protein